MALWFRAIPRLQQLASHVQYRIQPAAISIVRSTSIRSGPYLLRGRMSTHSIPKTMKGVMIEKTGGVEVLEYRTDLPVPVPKEGEVLIKNEVSGINYIDTYFRTGLYPAPKPEILGREGGGTVVSSAGSPPPYNLHPGTRVVWMATGGYAEYTAVSADNVFPIPESISFERGCASILQGLTAMTLIDDAYEVKKGDWLLVPAAAGGTGGWLLQLIKARGGHVIASASTEEKRKLAVEYGADVAVPYEKVLETVKEKTGGQGVAAAFDGVGKNTFDMSFDALARKGTLVSFGNASGAVPPFAISKLASKNAKVCRPTLYNYLVTKEEKEKYARELWEFVQKPGFRVEVHETYPLSEIRRAHEDFEGRKTTGKLLLDPSK